MAVLTDLLAIPFDPELAPGARNAIATCLAVKPHERVVVITGRSCLEIGAAFAAQLRAVGASHECFVLDDFVTRPTRSMPAPILEALEQAQVSIFAALALPGELDMRRQMTGVVNRRRIRHAHMVGITPRIMREGMRADFPAVDALSLWVMERAVDAREIVCTTPAGTDLRATFVPSLRWIKTSGLISPEKWGNLPGGEIFTSPERVDGTFVVDGVLGDWLAPKYGDLRKTPLTIRIEESRIVDLQCRNSAALEDFRRYVAADANSDRVGEYALGTNLAVTDVIGNMLQDEKIPGVHIAFGHPYAEHTGANWSSSSHIDVVGRDFDVWFDGTPIMRRGRYLRED